MPAEIPKASLLAQQVFRVNNFEKFETAAMDVFHYQYYHNTTYRRFCQAVNKSPLDITGITDIPFLPISFFKTHAITTTEFTPKIVFESSGTTGSTISRHAVKEASLYEQSFLKAFETFYGDLSSFCIIGLLPSYLERGHSSLVYMVQKMIERSGHRLSGFYLQNYGELAQTLKQLEEEGQKTLLIGVTYALLQFAASFQMPLHHTIVMETGGMKGRKKELVRGEVHALLQEAFSIPHIHSEYGMTELLSQAYAFRDGLFRTPPWMKVLIREEDDPFCISHRNTKSSGGITIIDLANIYSCSFIATEDIGRLHEGDTFEVLGRMDNSDIRGCSLLSL